MARWAVFGEVELGRLEANDREGAERAARRIYGDRLVRVQSVVSLEAAAAERRAARDPWEEDG
jgi:hypothetical protein